MIWRLYEWEVRRGERRLTSSCGVTDAPVRARCQMLDALGAEPAGEVAYGSVTAIEMALPHNHCAYLQSLTVVERDPNGSLRWLVLPSTDGRGR
jgi:hypothetical protein